MSQRFFLSKKQNISCGGSPKNLGAKLFLGGGGVLTPQAPSNKKKNNVYCNTTNKNSSVTESQKKAETTLEIRLMENAIMKVTIENKSELFLL